jgi:hypothetical protein
MVSENVKTKKMLERNIFTIIDEFDGFRSFKTEQEADNDFSSRPKKFIESLGGLNVHLEYELVEDYPPRRSGIGWQDKKKWKITLQEKDHREVICNLRMTMFGREEFKSNRNELLISGGCYVKR